MSSSARVGGVHFGIVTDFPNVVRKIKRQVYGINIDVQVKCIISSIAV